MTSTCFCCQQPCGVIYDDAALDLPYFLDTNKGPVGRVESCDTCFYTFEPHATRHLLALSERWNEGE